MDWKTLGKKLLFPPIWLIVLLSVMSAALLVTVFVKGWEQSLIAYFVYVLAFYSLSVVSVCCVAGFPEKYRRLCGSVYATSFGSRYMTDSLFRTKISLYLSLGVSLLYVGMNVWSWYFSRSWWFVVLAVYYAIMALIRFLLVGYVR